MTISREAKKQMTWASKGAVQFVANPVELGRRRAAGLGDFLGGAEFLAQTRDHSGRVIHSRRGDKLMIQRLATRRLGYRA